MAQNTAELSGLPDAPGVSAKRIIQLDNAIEKWRDILEKRMSLTEQEILARDRVLEVCHEKGITSYRYRDNDIDKVLVVVVGKEKVKLKNPEADGDNEGQL
jgi:hypothetical protein